MKKFISAITAAFVLFSSGWAIASEDAGTLSCNFDTARSTFRISGKFSETSGEAVTVLADLRDGEEGFSTSKLPELFFVYTTDEDGMLDISEKLSSSFAGGRYDVIVTGKTRQEKFSFVYMNKDDPLTLGVIDDINGAQTSEEVKSVVYADYHAESLGIDTEDPDIAKYLDSALEGVLELKDTLPGRSYTPELFLEKFSVLIAVSMINDSEVEAAMMKYASYFGTTSEAYQALDDEAREALDKLMEKTDFAYDKLDTAYAELLLTAQIRTAPNWSYMQDIVLDNKEALNISTGDYEDIKASARYKVFEEMYKNADDFENVAQIKSAFDKATDKVLRELADNQKPSKPSSGGGGGGGTSVSVPAVTPAPEKPAEDLPQQALTKVFYDIAGHFAADYIYELSEGGVINGYEDGSFRPGNPVTRAEFAKLVAVLFGIDANGGADYRDVSSSDWFAVYVDALSGADIITGYDGMFNPRNNITRQDAAVICLRTAEYLQTELSGTADFRDNADISDYALEAVGAMSANGIMNGDGTDFHPQDYITRGETAAILCRLKQLLNLEVSE